MKRFFTAFGFLTLLPYPQSTDFEGKDLGRSMSLFPLVGLLLGLILLLLNMLLAPYLPERLVNIIIIATLIIVTGGLHVDGFMDTLDGIGGGNNKERILTIMRDSHVGAFGVIGLILLLLIKWEALNSIGGETKGTALLLMPVISRGGQVLLTFLSPYARTEGVGRPFADGLDKKALTIAVTITLILSLILGGLAGILMATISGLFALCCSRFFIKKIGGITGDVIGALNELLEVLVLLLAAVWI